MDRTPDDILGMSDDDFLKDMPSLVSTTESASVSAPEPVAPVAPEPESVANEPAPVAPAGDEPNPLAAADDEITQPAGPTPAEPVAEPDAPAASGDKPDPAPGGEAEPPKVADPAQASPDYKAFYEGLVGKPIKANGKEIVLKTPEEVQRLVQMGAGYGKKLQDMQPHLKTLRMLEKANLLDENELSYLIDIRNKNPDAIKKLIKESGIDPLDLNIEDNISYTPTNHGVSDAEVAFHEALSEVKAREGGQETLQVINQSWDDESKAVLWRDPSLLGVFQTQRENGVYDTISAEIDRQKTLGMIPHSTPFLQAYHQVGNALYPPTVQPQAPVAPTTVAQPPAQPKVIAQRVEAPKAQVANSDKARAASPTQTSSRKAATFVNPLEMADDEFLKTFKGRL